MVTKSAIFNAYSGKYIAYLKGYFYSIFCLKTKAYAEIKETALTQKQWHLMFVSILVIGLGILLWFCVMFITVAQINCQLPDEFWSRTDTPLPSVLALFSTAFFLLFILNAMVFYTGEKGQTFKESFVTGTFTIANAFVITTILLMLFGLLQSNYEYRFAYEERIAVPYSSSNRCLQLEPFFGKWEILENTEIESNFSNYVLLNRDKTIKTDEVDLYMYYFGTRILNKYYSPGSIVSSLIPDSIKAGKSLKGAISFSYYACKEDFCNWHRSDYYFEKLDTELILVNVELIRTDNGYKYAVNGEYILLRAMAE